MELALLAAGTLTGLWILCGAIYWLCVRALPR